MPGKCKHSGKRWTVLIYADGNNEMEPEIYRGMQAMGNAPSPENVNVIIQWARAPQQLVKTLRGHAAHLTGEQWDGVRRYIIRETGIAQVADLGNVNMADPCTLADFLAWGVTNYPADGVMAILSGHGAGFMGVLTDYTQVYPMIMSIAGLTGAIRQCRRQTGKHVDILVIDACYMNMIEIWYELALTPTRPVKYLLTPLGEASLECLPYHLFIRQLRAGTQRRPSTRHSLADIVVAVNGEGNNSGDILAVNLAAANFVQLKQTIDQLAGFIMGNNLNLADVLGKEYCTSPHYPLLNLLELNNRIAAACPHGIFRPDIIPALLDRIIPVPPYTQLPKLHNLDASIFLPVTPGLYPSFATDYERLLLAAGNRWLQVLRGGETTGYDAVPGQKAKQRVLPPSVPMPISSVVYSLQAQTPHLTEEQIWQTVKELGWSE